MYKVYVTTIMTVLLTVSSCSLFDGSKNKRSGSALTLAGAGLISIDSSVGADRGQEIFAAIQTNLSNSMENGAYKYGAKGVTAKTFTTDQLTVLVGNCGADSSKCDVNIFISKGNDSMRPIFVIDPLTTTNCESKYKAYIRSTVMLSREALGVTNYYQNAPLSTPISNWDTYCASSEYRDLLCKRKTDIESSKKAESVSTDYGQLIFDAATSSTAITLTDVKFKANDADNVICIKDLIKQSMWGKDRRSNARQIGVFKVELEMVQ